MTILELRNLSVGYSGIAAVQDLDISVSAGEIVAVLGPNGAGKTTTVMGIAGLLRPLRGAVIWKGETMAARPHKRARAGMGIVLEGRQVFRQLTVEENLRLGLGTVDDAVAAFPELRDLLPRKAGLLSGGEQQMIILGRTLACKPSLLVVDELSLGLAPVIVRRLFGAFREFADRGVGVLVVEQHAQMILALADRAYILRQGKLQYAGAASTLITDRSVLQQAYFSG